MAGVSHALICNECFLFMEMGSNSFLKGSIICLIIKITQVVVKAGEKKYRDCNEITHNSAPE